MARNKYIEQHLKNLMTNSATLTDEQGHLNTHGYINLGFQILTILLFITAAFNQWKITFVITGGILCWDIYRYIKSRRK